LPPAEASARLRKTSEEVMARYTGPKVRLSRRLSTNIFENEKGRRALDRRPFPPGAHGRTRRRNAGSEYLAQLQEKQKAKYIYGVLEKQFKKTYNEAIRLPGPSGENLLRLLETRLDNVAYRAGWASTRPQARQFVNHGLVKVNGKRVDIPSYRVRKGDVVSLSHKAANMIVIQHNLDVLDRSVVGWLEVGDGGKEVTVRDLPQREHIDVPVRESLIVELYSK
jgi:small subunit ribosomal protein S4